MSQYIRYEDVPVVIGSLNQEPSFVFSNETSLSIQQSLPVKRYLDDHVISFTNTGDINFSANEVKTLTLGSQGGPAVPLSDSIEIIPSGTLITYPTGNKLYFEEDTFAGTYFVKVRAKNSCTISHLGDSENGEIEVRRNYSTDDPIAGDLVVNFYLDSGNLKSFFDLTGIFSEDDYPRVNESKVTGFFGNYFFDDAYLESLNFSCRAFYPFTASARLKTFGTLRYDASNIDNFFNNPEYNAQKNLPHGARTNIVGKEDAGMTTNLSFDYTINSNRSYEFHLETGGANGPSGELPVRSTKEEIVKALRIEGENINPYLTLSGKRANLKIELEDIGFTNFEHDSQGKLNSLEVYGPIVSQNLSAGDGSYLKGTVTVQDVYR